MDEKMHMYETLDGRYPTNTSLGFVMSLNMRWIGYSREIDLEYYEMFKMTYLGIMTRKELEWYVIYMSNGGSLELWQKFILDMQQ